MDITEFGYMSAAIISIIIVCIIAILILKYLFETGIIEMIIAMVILSVAGALIYGFTSFITGNIWIWQYSGLIICMSLIHGALLLLILALDDVWGRSNG